MKRTEKRGRVGLYRACSGKASFCTVVREMWISKVLPDTRQNTKHTNHLSAHAVVQSLSVKKRKKEKKKKY